MATYFRAKRDALDHFTGYPVIEGELLTPRERHTQARYLPDAVFETVEISRKKTFKFFGVRLERKD